MEAQRTVAQQLHDRRFTLTGHAEKVIHLSQGNDDRNAAGEAGNDRHGDKGREAAQLQHAAYHKNSARKKRGNEHALHGIARHYGHQNGRHRARGAADLVIAAGQQRDHQARHNGRNKACRRVRTAGHAEGQRQRQRDRRYRDAAEQIRRQRFCVVSLKLPFQQMKIPHVFPPTALSLYATAHHCTLFMAAIQG